MKKPKNNRAKKQNKKNCNKKVSPVNWLLFCSKNKKAQVGTGMAIFTSTILIIFIFLAFNIIFSLKSYTVSEDIKDANNIFRADQTLIAFTRIPEVRRIVYKQKEGCNQLSLLAEKYIGKVYGNNIGWMLRLKKGSKVLCEFKKGEPGLFTTPDSRIYSEQTYPLPISKEQEVLILRLDEYQK